VAFVISSRPGQLTRRSSTTHSRRNWRGPPPATVGLSSEADLELTALGGSALGASTSTRGVGDSSGSVGTSVATERAARG
jgi:hypothetical protein